MNDKGFTMIELLAAMVLLSILMLVAVPTVLNMMDQTRRKTIINDAKKLVSSVEYKVKNNNNFIKKPRSDGKCIVLTLGYLDLGNEFQEGPHGGTYLLDDSYVIVKYDPSGDVNYQKKYKYYVTLVEKYQGETYYGLFLYPYEKIFDKGAESFANGFNKNNLISSIIRNNSTLDGKLKNFSITNPASESEKKVRDICSTTIFKNTNGGLDDNVYDTEDALNEVNLD